MNKYNNNICRHQFCIISYDLINNCDMPGIVIVQVTYEDYLMNNVWHLKWLLQKF